MFPFIDYVKQTFSDDGTDQSVFNPTYKCMVMIEITDNSSGFGLEQSIYIDDDGAIDSKVYVYRDDSSTVVIMGGGFIMNSTQHELRADPGGSNFAFTLHIFRLPEDI